MKFLKLLKQKLCRHTRYDARWGLCKDCGWANPEWSAEKMMKDDCPYLFDPVYRDAFHRQIALDGKMIMVNRLIKSGHIKEASELLKGD